ncbi:MAG: FUN14 domain-containing protein [Candidatus Bathyarchaeia archaeon]
MLDASSVITSILSNVSLSQLGFAGILGYVAGWGLKKLAKLLSMVVGATLAVVGLIIAYLSSQNVIIINYNQLQVLIVNIGQWIIGTAESVLRSSQLSAGSVGTIGGLLFGFALGFRRE